MGDGLGVAGGPDVVVSVGVGVGCTVGAGSGMGDVVGASVDGVATEPVVVVAGILVEPGGDVSSTPQAVKVARTAKHMRISACTGMVA